MITWHYFCIVDIMYTYRQLTTAIDMLRSLAINEFKLSTVYYCYIEHSIN